MVQKHLVESHAYRCMWCIDRLAVCRTHAYGRQSSTYRESNDRDTHDGQDTNAAHTPVTSPLHVASANIASSSASFSFSVFLDRASIPPHMPRPKGKVLCVWRHGLKPNFKSHRWIVNPVVASRRVGGGAVSFYFLRVPPLDLLLLPCVCPPALCQAMSRRRSKTVLIWPRN